jgi:hypothetical protein
MAQELKPELIICDLTLPDIDGYETVSELKKEASLSSVPVILLAGSIEPFDEDLFKSSGADGVIFKPFDSQELLDKVGELLKDRVQIAEAEKTESRELMEEGWDFSDVFEEVELGAAGVDEISSEETFITELVTESDLPAVESVEDYDIGVDELGKEDTFEVGEPERMTETGDEIQEGDEEERDEFEELFDDLEMEVSQEIADEAGIVPKADEMDELDELVGGPEMGVDQEIADEAEIVPGADEMDELDELVEGTEMGVDQDIADEAEIVPGADEMDELDELVEGTEMEVGQEIVDEAEIVSDAVEAADVEREDFIGDEISDIDAPPSEPAELELDEAIASKGEEDQMMKMDEEDKMMEEIVRDVDEFPISSGYDIAPHGILKRGVSKKEGAIDDSARYEEKVKEVFSSEEFSRELKGLVADITEKILWEVLPGIMEDLKSEIVSVIKEVSASVVPEVADRIIQEEIKRIREEIEFAD